MQPQKVVDNYKLAILDTLLVGLLVGLPMLWISIMGWLGIRLDAAVLTMMSAADRNAQKSAESSAAAISFVAKKAVSAGMSKRP